MRYLVESEDFDRLRVRAPASPEYGMTSSHWPFWIGGRSEMTSFTVTLLNGAPSVCGTAEYCKEQPR